MVRTYFNLIIPNERQETIMIKLKQKLHGNRIIKRLITVTPEDDNHIKKQIETFFGNGRITVETINVHSVKKTYHFD